MPTWNEIFKEKGRLFKNRQNDMPKILRLFKKKGVKRILDFGCGYGRHTIYMAKEGFEAYGFDISPVGLKMARVGARREGVKIRLKKGSIYQKLPYPGDFFDAIVCIQVIQHGRIGQIRKAIKEFGRVLKPKGMIFITVPRTYRKKTRRIAPRTLVPVEGMEKGIVHYIFTKGAIRKEFGNFRIERIWVSRVATPPSEQLCFVGELRRK